MKESEGPGLSDKVMLPPILHLRDSSLFLKEKTLNPEIAVFEQNSTETVVFTGRGVQQFTAPWLYLGNTEVNLYCSIDTDGTIAFIHCFLLHQLEIILIVCI